METDHQKNLAKQMDKQGLRVYALLALVVYILALVYCYKTDHFFEVGLLGVVMLVLGSLIGWIYKND